MSSPADRRRVRAALLSMAALLVTAVGALTAPSIASAYTTQNASFSGISCSGDNLASQWGSVAVPANAVTATVTVTGGGGAGGDNNGGGGGVGGGGGIVTSTFTVAAGQTVWARVGCGAPDGGGNAAGYTTGGSAGPLGGGGGGSSAVCVNTGAGSCSGGTVYAIAAGGGGGGRAFDGSFPCSDEGGGSGGTAHGGSTSGGQQGGTGYGGARGGNGGGGTNGGGGGGGIGQGPGQNTGATSGNNTGGTGGTGDGGRNAANGGNATSVSPGGSGGNGSNALGDDGIISGGGGGGYTGGGAGGGGDDGSTCNNDAGAGGGAGASWVSGSASSVGWGNAGANVANCTNSGIGTNPGGGGNQGVGGCDGNATISFKINTLPTGSGQQISVTKGVGQQITLGASDTAGEGTPTCINVSGPSQGKGTLTGSGCSYTYTAGANTSGSDSFTYQVRDADGAVSASTYTITLNIGNRAPTGAAQSGLTATKGTPLSIALANADLDGDSRTCSLVSGSGPSKGTVTLSGGSPSTDCAANYKPNANTSGADSFSYRVTDSSSGVSADYLISLNVVNRAPTSAAQSITVAPGSDTVVTLGGSDPDGDATTCASGAPSGGSLSSQSSCAPTYTAPSTLGTYSFGYTRSDAFGGVSSPATVTINVQSPDVAVTKSHVGAFNDGTQGSYTIGVSNVGNAPTAGTITVVDDLPAGMTYVSSDAGTSGFTCSSGSGGAQVTCTRTAALPASASTSFTVTVAVAAGAESGSNTATVSATPDASTSNNTAVDPTTVNLRPTAGPVSAATTVNTPVTVSLDGSDPEGGALTYQVGTPSSGSLSGTGSERTFTPAAGSDAPVTFSYTVTDPNGHVSFAATVSITVTRPGIHGTVVSDDTGAGIAGITVRLYQDGVGFTSKSATTNAAGSYDIGPAIPDGTYRVMFRDPTQSYVDEWHGDTVVRSSSTPVTFAAGDVVTLDAGLATGAEIDVTITNPGTFTVALYNVDPTASTAFRSVSGVSGSTALRGLPAGSYYVSVTDPAKTLEQRWSGNQTDRAAATPIAVTSGSSQAASFTLAPPNTIAGTVIDSEGPLPSVTVQAYNAQTAAFVKSAKTDAEGTYAIKGLPAGQYKLVFRDSSGDHPVTWYGGGEAIASGSTVTMADGEVLTIDSELPVAATISGTIFGGPGGVTPLAGAKVTPYRDGVAVRTFVTDAQGRYTATGLAAGSYTVLFMAPGHKTEYNLNRPRKADADIITIGPGDELELDATLAPA